MSADAGRKIITVEQLRTFAAQLLHAGGFRRPDAQQTADLLVWANARGVDSHGVLRIPRYIEMAKLGIIDPHATPHFTVNFGAISMLDGDNAPGAVVMNMAAARAVELALAHGIGWCSARNITHAGAVGYFAEEITRSGQIGVIMTASKPLMSYFGSRAEGVSTNPIAIAAPNPNGEHPIVFDMSTAAAALGKIMAAKDAGVSIPIGWGVDERGADTTDPRAVKSLLPMAGAKGSGLSLMIEILSSVLVSNPIISRALTGDGKASFNGIALAIDLKAFGDPADFYAGITQLSLAIKGLPVADGVDAILLPGERGYSVAARRQANGVPLEAATAANLVKLAANFGIEAPAVLR